jgi:hypothetical protein
MAHLRYEFSMLFTLINGSPFKTDSPPELPDPMLAFSNILLYKED